MTETAPADIGSGDGDGDVTGNNDDDDNGGSNGLSAGAIIGIVIGVIIAVALLSVCVVLFVFGSRKREGDGAGQGQQPAVYSSSDAAATPPPPPPPAVVPPPPPFAKDEARDMGAPDSGAGGGDATEAAAAAAAAAATAAAAAARDAPGDGTDPTGALVVSDQPDGEQGAMVAALARGPTPPPHDYVLGAGPAATRTDFDNLQARFEREEIGDHSAVLGVDRTSTGEALAAPAILPAVAADDSNQQEAQDGGAGDDQGDTLPAPLGDEQVDSGLPDREAINVPTFEKQEQMMAGGDGSGAISNVAGGLHGTTITEEGGDVPSLERDPIEMSRDRDTPF